MKKFAILFIYPNNSKEFHGFSQEDIILSEDNNSNRLKKIVLLKKIQWNVDFFIEICIVKFADFSIFQKKLSNLSDSFNQDIIVKQESYFKVSNVHHIKLKQKLSR